MTGAHGYTRPWWVVRGSQRGAQTTPHRCSWLILGPFTVEIWCWWFRLGLCAGKWYVGAYVGPIALTVGPRAWRYRQTRHTITVGSTDWTTE